MSLFNTAREVDNERMTLVGTIFRGIVIDNNDPKKMGRVKIRVNGLFKDDETIPWSMNVLNMPCADKVGGINIPEVNSQVSIMYLSNDLLSSIYFGASYSTDFKLEDNLLLNYPYSKGWVDSAGNVFVFNQEKGYFKVQLASGALIVFDSKGLRIDTVKSGVPELPNNTNDNYEKPNNSDKKDINSDGLNITIRGPVNIHASEDASVFAKNIRLLAQEDIILKSKNIKMEADEELGVNCENHIINAKDKIASIGKSQEIQASNSFSLYANKSVTINTKEYKLVSTNYKASITSYNVEASSNISLKANSKLEVQAGAILDMGGKVAKLNGLAQIPTTIIDRDSSSKPTVINWMGYSFGGFMPGGIVPQIPPVVAVQPEQSESVSNNTEYENVEYTEPEEIEEKESNEIKFKKNIWDNRKNDYVEPEEIDDEKEDLSNVNIEPYNFDKLIDQTKQVKIDKSWQKS